MESSSSSPPTAAAPPKGSGHSRAIIAVIGVFKLLKGMLMLLVAVAALEFTRPSVREAAHRWATEFGFAPHRTLIATWLLKVAGLNAKEYVAVALGASLYAAVFITEGIGLLLDKAWAEWMAVISTAGLIPFEAWELHKKLSAGRVATVVANVAVVIYLVIRVYTRTRDSKAGGHNAK